MRGKNRNMKERLDILLTEKMGIKSRSKAAELIKGGFVFCNGKQVTKAGMFVTETDKITISENDVLKYVSRGGLKLEKAIKEFQLDFKGMTVLDIGSSTGGFTDCALQKGARKVIAVDVGTDIMDERLRKDPRVELHEKTDIRDFDIDKWAERNKDQEKKENGIGFCVCDASFISLPTALCRLGKSRQSFRLVTLIKPQFECGPETASKYKGVIKNEKIHTEIIRKVLSEMKALGFELQEITFSPICGGDGNIEYLALFLHEGERILSGEKNMSDEEITKLVKEAFERA